LRPKDKRNQTHGKRKKPKNKKDKKSAQGQKKKGESKRTRTKKEKGQEKRKWRKKLRSESRQRKSATIPRGEHLQKKRKKGKTQFNKDISTHGNVRGG
jgi:hypothetical protein